jgi:hypothetical protein
VTASFLYFSIDLVRRERFGRLNAAPGAPPGIEVRRGGRLLADPYVVQVHLVNEGRRDIPSAAFDQQRPLTLDVGAPILEILKATGSPECEVPVTIQGTSVQIGPALIVRRQRMAFSLLVDGSAPRLTCPLPPLIDIDVRYGDPPTPSQMPWAVLAMAVAVALGVLAAVAVMTHDLWVAMVTAMVTAPILAAGAGYVRNLMRRE